MKKTQGKHQIVDVSGWLRNEPVYPEGKRVKALVYCPANTSFDFLEVGHGYMFKESPSWAPEQFWVEILAYHIGSKMGVSVPVAFVAVDNNLGKSGALIRWFLESSVNSSGEEESYISGGDFCHEYINDFDRKSGSQHNFATIHQIFTDLAIEDWLEYWAKMLTFDALIGNTDRHQDNWGIIESGGKIFRMAPAFDNGSSMGYEKQPDKFHLFNDQDYLLRYVLKGLHHMKWQLSDSSRVEHIQLLENLSNNYPQTRQVMLKCLELVNADIFETILNELIAFDVPVKLSKERADFMLKLLNFRHQRLLNALRF